VIPPNFADAYPFRNGRASIRQGEFWGAVDIRGELVIPPRFGRRLVFTEGLAEFSTGDERDGDKRGLVNKLFDSDRFFCAGFAVSKAVAADHDCNQTCILRDSAREKALDRVEARVEGTSLGMGGEWGQDEKTGTISADFAKVEEIANRAGKGSLIRAKCGMRASSSDSSEPLLLVHRSARERCCLMSSRRDVIPQAHKTGIWGT
jgi:hypothetical protein